jgi:hypothetical protein
MSASVHTSITDIAVPRIGVNETLVQPAAALGIEHAQTSEPLDVFSVGGSRASLGYAFRHSEALRFSKQLVEVPNERAHLNRTDIAGLAVR